MRCTFVLIAILAPYGHSLALFSSFTSNRPLGCAETPGIKRKVAVFGAGGYLGAYTFGYLQRAASLYGTGIGGASSPRNLCATSLGSQAMNKVLGKNFCLSYAGEQHIRLTNMKQIDSIIARLDGYDAIVMGTMYRLEKRPITSGTYEKRPNDKTLEFYLDEPRREETVGPQSFEMDVHLELFINTIEACKEVGVKHVVVIETPQTEEKAPEFLSILQASGLHYTYYRCNGHLLNFPDHTFWKGIQGDLSIAEIPLDNIAEWSSQKVGESIYREDLAATICQGLQYLPWTTSRCLSVTCHGSWDEAIQIAPKRQDRIWCGNSASLGTKFAAIM
jgi:hypothetical protein